MREEAVVVTARASIAHADVADAACSRLVGKESAQVDSRFLARVSTRELRVDVGAHFIARTADRWTEVKA